MKNKKNYLLLMVSFLLTGCFGVGDQQEPAPVYGDTRSDSAEITAQPEVSTKALQVDERPIDTYPLQEDGADYDPMSVNSRKPSASPAVVALMSHADASSQSGDLETAVSTVERALRIEPRNALLVYKLATLRLEQNKPGLAEDLAKKSALLAGDDKALKKSCWLLIADAREKQGDRYGADEAKKKAASY